MNELKLNNCRELTEEELYNTDGGWIPWAISGVIFVGGAVAGYMDQKQENKKKK
ncbi:class IIb bacteriocin, lactobin A/cerein 7B family (plasmid) [Bacillus mycoides]|uniref:class IIb bacteriocin, lactobin A/cerein 7B family n=1 Tax=Bacillus mycoides TaxID=1405 RepID=UPI001C028EC0|nr:class IIb bacteriocin, lactobin A/cerein 7B family [Bacillus mycoides]QWG48395.1 class IIb bacteriocin, lactobin A/cerein 7B family [Bacillus mycoides]